MGRRKRKEIDNFIPSKYQQDIFEYIEKESGNLVIEAYAGCGKTTTLIKMLDFIQDEKQILFCAFNTDIVKDLQKKIPKKENIELKTIHGLGYKMLNINIKGINKEPNVSKYKSFVFNNIKELSNINTYALGKQRYYLYLDNIYKLIDFLRLNLIDNPKDAQRIIEMHDINIIADEVNVALKAMNWGKEHVETIDFTDMIWLPNVLYLKPWGCQYDFVFVDEAQDLSIAQRELVLKCQKISTRYIFVGDKNQCIYAFASASPDSFDFLKTLPNTISLPLSISYRCGKNIVKFAQNLVPQIEYKEDAIDGEIKYNAHLKDVNDGDMILCRNNAPLMTLYNELINSNKKCFIRGKDIGDNLIKLIKNTNKSNLGIELNEDGVFMQLYKSFFKERDSICSRYGLSIKDAEEEPFCADYLDKIKALEIISENCNNTDELIAKIKTIFSDKGKEGIALSTIHKAKGLEANNIYIACRSLMPHKSAKKEWQILQEKNITYVAYTRAKNILAFLNEQEMNEFKNVKLKYDLREIENRINVILSGNITPATAFNKTILTEINYKNNTLRKGNVKTLSLGINKERKQPLLSNRKKIKTIQKEIYG